MYHSCALFGIREPFPAQEMCIRDRPILHIMQIDPLKVVANISEQYFRNVKVGMPCLLYTSTSERTALFYGSERNARWSERCSAEFAAA